MNKGAVFECFAYVMQEKLIKRIAKAQPAWHRTWHQRPEVPAFCIIMDHGARYVGEYGLDYMMSSTAMVC